MQNHPTKITTVIPPILIALMLLLPISALPDIAVAKALPGYSVPTYNCVRNWYLSPTGRDSNAGNSAGAPWLTLQHADANVQPGDCVNLASGTYSQTTPVALTHGGNANTATGFVVYRSTVPKGAHLVMANPTPVGVHLINLYNYGQAQPSNYLIFDGLELDGNNGYAGGACLGVIQNGVHHIVVENSLIHGCAAAGIGLGWGEYYWAVNNTAYNNCMTYDGSGISVHEADLATVYDPSFVPNASDKALYYHMVIANNIVHHNITLATNAAHTDGQGIIFDDFNHYQREDPRSNTTYTRPTIIVSNIAYNNGAGGITIYESQNVTVANSSAYNNYIDTQDT